MPIITSNDINSSNLDPTEKALWVATLSAADGIVAFAGGGQAGAVQIANMTTRVVTVGTAGDSVKLPPAVPGLMLMVINAAAANSMNVFPSTGQSINALGANAAFAQAANKIALFMAASPTQWHSILSA